MTHKSYERAIVLGNSQKSPGITIIRCNNNPMMYTIRRILQFENS